MPYTLFLSVVENFLSEAAFILKDLFVFIIFLFVVAYILFLHSHMYVGSSKSDYFVAFVLKCIKNFYFFEEKSVKQNADL